METVWFTIVWGMLAVYTVLDGFDFGVMRRVGQRLPAIAAATCHLSFPYDHCANRHFLLGEGDLREGDGLPHEVLVIGVERHGLRVTLQARLVNAAAV